MSKLFKYSPADGALYARTFALFYNIPDNQRLFYYEAGKNCTNFISQCVWASYGGWLPGFSDKAVDENRQRIVKDVRQVKGVWYGSENWIGSGRWCRVGEFYEFVTDKTKKVGPMATKIAEGTFNQVLPSQIKKGDVIQLIVETYIPGTYGHGLYVTNEGERWEDITICSNSDDRLDVPMSWFADYPEIYSKMRVLRFSDAYFSL